jgi:hypothetical protein
MSSFSFANEGSKPHPIENLKVSPTGLVGKLNVLSGEQGEFWLCIIPSLNVSGYGKNEEEATESLKENIHTFCEDLFSISQVQRNLELKKLGWEPNKFFRKKYSKAYVDENGVLQNFNNPAQVKRKVLEAA